MADVAVTDEQEAKGLDIKNNLIETQGVLFVFEQPNRYGFWMKSVKYGFVTILLIYVLLLLYQLFTTVVDNTNGGTKEPSDFTISVSDRIQNYRIIILLETFEEGREKKESHIQTSLQSKEYSTHKVPKASSGGFACT